MITALTVSDRAYDRCYHGIKTVVHAPGGIRDAAQAQAARFDAIAKVDTSHFFFLDDDDDLPPGYEAVLERALAVGKPLVYTDEMVRSAEEGEHVWFRGDYSQAAHLRDRMLVHHLALCDTGAARAAIARLPRGHFWPEMMLYWEMAKAGAAHLPEVCYLWNRRPTGLHTLPAIIMAQTRAAIWCRDNP
mgnify:CR=1 FL=1